MKITIEQLEYLIGAMKSTQAEHPKAKVYYNWEDCTMHIAYPLPKDMIEMKQEPVNKD